MGLVYFGGFILGAYILIRIYDALTSEKRLNEKIQTLEVEKQQLKQANNQMREVAVFRDHGSYDHFDRYRITHLNRDVDTEKKELIIVQDTLRGVVLNKTQRANFEYIEAKILKQIADDKQKYKIFMLTNGKRR